MTAPWLRQSKTEDFESIAAMCAVGLQFLVGTFLAFAVVYSPAWIFGCSFEQCGVAGIGVPIYGFLILDILLFLVAWWLTLVLASKGWWRIAPPLAGTAITVALAGTALYWVLVGVI